MRKSARKDARNARPVSAGLLTLALGMSQTALAEPGGAPGEDTRVDVIYENATFARKDVGLSKFRNTLKVDVDRKLGKRGAFDDFGMHVKLRGTFDGVYRMNEDEYGNRAGGAIRLENTVGIPGGAVAHGEGLGSPANPLTAGLAGLPGGGAFGFNATDPSSPRYNPNEGLVALGTHLARTDGGVSFGVPVRPCDEDKRGCIKDYLDADRQELESPEFNDRLDFIREAYFSGTIPLDSGAGLFVKVGKQQVVWGRTDLFRVLDVINPVDYSRNNIYDELQDIRIPMWIAQAEYRAGPTETFDDLNFAVVWNFDKFRPHNIGQCGSPNVILDAGCFMRGMKNLWDNGGTVANFANLGIPGFPGLAATDFGPNQIGIRKAHLPGWSLKNTQLGVKLEGQKSGVGFSLNALTYRSQLPSLRGGIPARNPFDPVGAVDTAPQPHPYPYLIAFDIHFPRINLIGGSMDLQVDAIKSVFRLEAALTHGEEFPNGLREKLYSRSRVFRYVIGWDRPTFIPFLNKDRAFLISGQVFGQHLLDHELETRPLGKVGMPDWEQNNIVTLLVKGFYMNDRVSPQVIMAHDIKARATAIAPSIDWLVTDNLKLSFGANIKVGRGARTFDDCRTCNPFHPFSASPGQGPRDGSLGLGGHEPLGRFRAGPIGMAQKEDELQFTLQYTF